MTSIFDPTSAVLRCYPIDQDIEQAELFKIIEDGCGCSRECWKKINPNRWNLEIANKVINRCRRNIAKKDKSDERFAFLQAEIKPHAKLSEDKSRLKHDIFLELDEHGQRVQVCRTAFIQAYGKILHIKPY